MGTIYWGILVEFSELDKLYIVTIAQLAMAFVAIVVSKAKISNPQPPL